jgi:hypothetical protein
MAIQFWQNMSILIGQLELACHGKNVNLATEVTPLDTTALCTTGWTTVVGGLKAGTVDMELMADFADGMNDERIWGYLGANDTAHSVVTNSADGSVAYLFKGIPLSYKIIDGAPGDLAMASISGRSASSPVVRGRLLHPGSASRTASSVGTGRQLGDVDATQRVYAALHVITVSGTSPTLDVIVQSDDNSGFTTPTSRITFSQATAAANRQQFSSVAGAIADTHWRVSYTIGGSDTPTFAFAVTVGIV